MTPRLFGILFAAGLVTLAAGAGAYSTVPQTRPRVPERDMLAGLGDRPGTPVVEPLDLHPDILILSVKGYLNDEDCEGPQIGQGEEELCLTACNRGAEDVVLDTHGAMWQIREVPNSGGGPEQSLVFVERGSLLLGPGTCGTGGIDKKKEEELKAQAEAGTLPQGVGVRFRLKVVCLNASKGIPDEDDTYDMVGRASHPQLKEILALIEGKTLTDDGVDLVQDAVWEVTDYGGLTDEMRAKLRAL